VKGKSNMISTKKQKLLYKSKMKTGGRGVKERSEIPSLLDHHMFFLCLISLILITYFRHWTKKQKTK
jgi:hypothetical protein